MNVAFIVNEFPSVSQTFVLNQITALKDLGHRVFIFAERPSGHGKIHKKYEQYHLMENTAYHDVPRNKLLRFCRGLRYVVRYLPRNFTAVARSLDFFRYGKRAASLNLLYLVIPFIKNGPFDIVHCQFGVLGLKGTLLKQTGAVKCGMITSIRGFDITKYLKKHPGAYDELFREGDLFLPVSRSLSRLLAREGCDRQKILIHHSGIDCSAIQYKERKRTADETIKLITIARLVEKKGVAFAIEAVARVIGKGKKISYSIIGDGILRDELRNMIKRLGVEAQVELLGWKTHEEALLLLRDAHVMLAPSITSTESDQEGIPNALKEAMASGMPVISTLHGGIAELVQDGVSGFLVPERDPDALAKRLLYLIEHHEMWPEMGRQGRKMIEENYDINKLSRELAEIYGKLSIRGSYVHGIQHV
ncbi:MAG: glycosyltransferase [Nitrospirae bacterium]|nr:glycosyltransferase [Nitrospirota bacterium]